MCFCLRKRSQVISIKHINKQNNWRFVRNNTILLFLIFISQIESCDFSTIYRKCDVEKLYRRNALL